MDGWMDEMVVGWDGGWWMDGWMDGWIDGWMIVQIDERKLQQSSYSS